MQEESTRNGSTNVGRLVLGYDAGCSACTDLANRVAQRVGDKLDVRNLRDPELQGWREQALGEDAKWAPTLFRVDEGSVEAWTGWRMGWALSRAMGPAATWRVMQALGEVGAAPKIEESKVVDKLPEKAAEAVVGISRGRFLKGVGGAAVAMSVLSGTGGLASPAQAARSPYDIVRSKELTARELTEAARRVGSSVDVKNLVGLALSTADKVRAAKPVAFMHTLRNGTAQRVVVYHMSNDRTLAHVQYSVPPASRAASRAMLWRPDGGRWVATKASEGGALWRRVADSRSSIENGGITALGECPPVGPPPDDSACWTKTRACAAWSTSFSCVGGAITLGSGCPFCPVTILAGGAAGAVIPACGSCLGGAVALLDCCKDWCDVWVKNVCD